MLSSENSIIMRLTLYCISELEKVTINQKKIKICGLFIGSWLQDIQKVGGPWALQTCVWLFTFVLLSKPTNSVSIFALASKECAPNTDWSPASETQGQIVGPKTKIKTGGKKFSVSAQSGASIRSAVWNWCVKSLSPGARIFLSYFCSSNFFPPVLIFVFGPTICPWVSEDDWSRDCMGQRRLNKWILGRVSGIPRRFCRGGWHHHQLDKGERGWWHRTYSLIFDYYWSYFVVVLNTSVAWLQW